jgi:hypothetical protein
LNWGRTILGPPGRGLGRGRWPVTTILAAVVGVFLLLAGDVLLGVIVLGLAAVFGFLTFRSFQ